jgi:cation diffusion facilitator family transporter
VVNFEAQKPGFRSDIKGFFFFTDHMACIVNTNSITSMSSMNSANPSIAILYAFAANLGIAAAKAGAAFWTGSGSLLAEAIHSFADCGNQVLLYIGLKRSEKTATRKHPMGFGRESYIWSMMVAFILFSVGGVFSIHEGWQRYTHPYTIENEGIALLILVIALGLEYYSLKQAMAALQQEKGERSLWQWFKETQSSELMVVTGEDLAALTGLGIALIMLALTMITGNTAFDAVGSILIGLLLIIVAIVVGSEVHSLLLGEAAEDISDSIQQYLESQSSVLQVFNVWAINHGNQVMVTIKAELLPDMAVSSAVNQINAMERQIKQTHARVKWIFFEIDDAA